MTARLGVIGHPVGHSVSPTFQQAALDAIGFDARYEAWDVQADDLAATIATLRDADALGANVTIPYKEAAARHVDRLHETARSVGAVNTIVNSDGSLEGYNTDVSGFQTALREAGIEPRGAHALLWGAGGSARAVAWALIGRGVRAITIVNRTPARAGRLRHHLAGHPGDLRLRAYAGDDPETAAALRDCDLAVNCTPVGILGSDNAGVMPFDVSALPPGAAVVDLVANPSETSLVAAARGAGHPALGGLPMLVHQGAASFELWTGRPAPLATMFAAAEAAMGQTSAPLGEAT